MPVEMKLTGPWKETGVLLTASPEKLEKAAEKAIEDEGEFIAGKLRQKLETGPFAPISPLAEAFGREMGPPIAGLAKWVVVKRFGNAVFVGIPSDGASGKLTRADIGQIHEEGRDYIVRMTDKQRRYVMAMLSNAGLIDKHRKVPPTPGGAPGMIHIVIPARPYLAPTIEKWMQPGMIQERVRQRVAATLGPPFTTSD